MTESLGTDRKPEQHPISVTHKHMSALDRLGWLVSALLMTSLLILMIMHENGLSRELTLIGLDTIAINLIVASVVARILERRFKAQQTTISEETE